MWTNGWDPSWSGTGYAREEAAGGGKWGLDIYSSGCVSFMAKLPLTLTHVLDMRGKGRGRQRKRSEKSKRKGGNQDGTLKRWVEERQSGQRGDRRRLSGELREPQDEWGAPQ